MIRAQCIVTRGNRVLMVRHRVNGEEWWCLPGGGVEPGETIQAAALRELQEECCVRGTLVRQTSYWAEAQGTDTVTFQVEIGDQKPRLGSDPELQGSDPILAGMSWLTMAEICERDRAYLWAAGLLSLTAFLDEISTWGEAISYPVGETNV